MKTTKKVLSIFLAVMLLVGIVAVGVSAETMVFEKTGSKLVYTATASKEANEDGVIELIPGETITVSVYAQANYYLGTTGSEIFCWTAGFFEAFSDSDVTTHNFVNNYTPNKKVIASTSASQLGTGYNKGTHAGYVHGRTYSTDCTSPYDASTATLGYTFTFKVPETATIGAKGEFRMPETCSATVATTSRMKQIYAAVNNSDTAYGSTSLGSEYPETIDLTGTILNFEVVSAEVPAVPCDYTALDAALTAAQTADTTNCTSASVNAFNDALAAAQAVARDLTVDDEGANQKLIDDAAAALNAAIAGLTKLGACNYAALDAAIAAYEAKLADKDLYTNWADYEAAYNAAKAIARDMIADEAGANQKVIDDAAAALNAVVLTYKAADYTAVDAAKAAATAIDASKYTAASVKAVNDAVAAVVTGYDITKQAEVDAMAAAINDAIANLVPLGGCNYAALDAAIARKDALNVADWTPSSWTASGVDAAYAAAKAVERDMLADEAGANQKAIDDAAAALNAAIDALKPVADKTALAAAIARAKALNEDDYTPESWAAADIDSAILVAEEVYANADAPQTIVDGMVSAIERAEAKLVKKADKTALKVAIDTLPEVAEDEATSETWAAYEEELAKANAVYADANATQDAVDAAEANLLAAIAGVKALAPCDYTALDEAIATTPEYTEEYYDAADYAAYKAALAAAKAVERDMLADEAGVNQAKIDDAAAALVNAYNALVPAFVDRSALEDALALTPEYGAEYYDAAAYAAWQDAVQAGNDTYEGLDGEPDVDWAREEVAAAANAITAAFAKLVPEFIDYSVLEEAVANYGTTPEAAEAYTEETYKPYASALERAENMLENKDENAPASDTQLQATIDAAAAELESTYKALEIAPVVPEEPPVLTIVTDVRATEEYYQVGDTVNFEFDCAITNVTKLQVVFANGSTLTYHRAHSAVVSIVDNGDGTETWTIALPIYYDNMDATARGKLDRVWEDEGRAFNLETKAEESKEDVSVKSAEVLLNDAAVSEFAATDTVVLKIVCGPDTLRIRLVDQTDGGTSTYNRSMATQDENGNWVWLITRTFGVRAYAYDIYTADSSNKLTDEGTDLTFTVKAYVPYVGPSTGNDEDIVISATAKARVLRGNEQVFTVVTDKDCLGIRITDQYGSTVAYTRDVAAAADNGDGTLTWTLTSVCTHADTYTSEIEALYADNWMSNGTTVTYRVVY